MTIYHVKTSVITIEPLTLQCSRCGTMHTMDMHIMQKYAQVMGIPLFPIGKTGVSMCAHCKQVVRRRDMSGALRKSYYQIKRHAHAPLWTWAGTVLLLLVIGAISLLTQ